jgi:hypothetical protein
MFLIKRPFSGPSRLEGAYSYGKTKEKDFCKKVRRAEAATGPQSSRQEGGLEKERA